MSRSFVRFLTATAEESLALNSPEGALDPLTHFVRETGTGQWLSVLHVSWQPP